MHFVDTHAHLYTEDYLEDLDSVLGRARMNGVSKIFLPNIDENSIARMLEISEKNPDFLYPMMGLHPTDLHEDYKEVLARMEEELGRNTSRYIGVGEVGLDYYWDDQYKKEQIAAFETQVLWALKYDLPLMIHCRSAHEDLIRVLEPFKNEPLRGVFHSFVGTEEEAEQLLSFPGFALGVNGIVTFKKSPLPEVLRNQVPLSRIVLETDSPYLAPVPNRGKRNESGYTRYVLEKISDIYEVSPEKTAEITNNAVRKIFGILVP